jgi:hypothetical protein
LEEPFQNLRILSRLARPKNTMIGSIKINLDCAKQRYLQVRTIERNEHG